MTRSRLGLKALGVCALVSSLMAVWAGAAQAESTGGKWTYLNEAEELKTFEEELAEVEIGMELERDGKGNLIPLILHTEAFKIKILYECKALETAAGTKLKANGVVLGKLIFKGCKAFLNGVFSANAPRKKKRSPPI
jgi:hypothetical protein